MVMTSGLRVAERRSPDIYIYMRRAAWPTSLRVARRLTWSARFDAMTQAQRDAAYNNGEACAHMLPAWRERTSAISRQQRSSVDGKLLDIKYGRGKDERLDYLPALGDTPNSI